MNYEPSTMNPQQTFQSFVRLFNQGLYRQALDPIEELWFAARDPFYQGLVQLTVALNQLFHYRLVSGPKYLLASAEQLLQPYLPRYKGLDTQAVLDYIRRCQEAIGGEEASSVGDLPRLHLEWRDEG